MENIVSHYLEQSEKNREKKCILETKISKCRKEIKKLKEELMKVNHISWVNGVIQPLAHELANRLDMEYSIYGPFGMRAATTIYLLKDKEKSILEQPTLSITLIPRDLQKGEFFYETGEIEEKHAEGTIAHLNGMNNVEAPLPRKIDEIIKLLR